MSTDQDIKDKPRTGKINYRVKNLGEVLSHLKSKGVAIEKTAEYPSYGNFGGLQIQMAIRSSFGSRPRVNRKP